jgi:hypothetical protein
MCSTLEARLARLRAAIDEVALAARAARGGHTGPDGHTELDGHTGPDGNTELDGRTDPSELAERLASLWGMIAELDPALAARLHGYGPDAGWDTPLCRHRAAHRACPRPLFVIMPTATGAPGARAPGQIQRAHGEAGRRPASMVSRLAGVSSRRSRFRWWRSPRGAAVPAPDAHPPS